MMELPSGYRETLVVDLLHNKKLALLVNALSLLLVAVMVALGLLLHPVSGFSFDLNDALRLLGFCAAMIAYIFLHELVHGVFMKRFSGVKPHYGFNGLYAYAGSAAYFPKNRYCVIAFAPVVLIGLVILILNIVFADSAFWFFYGLQILNVSGAAGDFYVRARFSRMEQGILINDTGVCMRVYARSAEE